MPFNLRGRHFLRLLDFRRDEVVYLLDLAAKLKADKRAGIRGKTLDGKNIALLFEKASTRTRCAFTVAAVDEGAHAEYLGKDDIQLGKKESVKDTARVLGRMFDGIQFRGYAHATVEGLARWSGVPVWNGLTDRFHPTQVLADFQTVQEEFGQDLRGVRFTYVGDGRNNVANSLMEGCALLGMDFRIATPEALFPDKKLVAECKAAAQDSGGKITITKNVAQAVKRTQVVYTDVWASMGEEAKIPERIKLLKSFKVTTKLMSATQDPGTIFLHCLPCFHDLDTDLARQFPDIREADDSVFEGSQSRVFEEAENRVHTIKAIMVATLG
jgi:ornithine carbamoyltransferase